MAKHPKLVKLILFDVQLGAEETRTGDVTSWARQTCDELRGNGIAANRHHNWHRRCCLLGGLGSWRPMRYNHVAPKADQFGGEANESRIVVLGPARFEYEVLSLGVTEVTQALAQRLDTGRVAGGGGCTEKPDTQWLGALLRARRERPRRSRSAESKDERAPTHVEHGAHSSHFGRVCPIAAAKSLGRPELF